VGGEWLNFGSTFEEEIWRLPFVDYGRDPVVRENVWGNLPKYVMGGE
jgi:hypothetical protein